jgi:hypothetical protein
MGREANLGSTILNRENLYLLLWIRNFYFGYVRAFEEFRIQFYPGFGPKTRPSKYQLKVIPFVRTAAKLSLGRYRCVRYGTGYLCDK